MVVHHWYTLVRTGKERIGKGDGKKEIKGSRCKWNSGGSRRIPPWSLSASPPPPPHTGHWSSVTQSSPPEHDAKIFSEKGEGQKESHSRASAPPPPPRLLYNRTHPSILSAASLIPCFYSKPTRTPQPLTLHSRKIMTVPNGTAPASGADALEAKFSEYIPPSLLRSRRRPQLLRN